MQTKDIIAETYKDAHARRLGLLLWDATTQCFLPGHTTGGHMANLILNTIPDDPLWDKVAPAIMPMLLHISHMGAQYSMLPNKDDDYARKLFSLLTGAAISVQMMLLLNFQPAYDMRTFINRLTAASL